MVYKHKHIHVTIVTYMNVIMVYKYKHIHVTIVTYMNVIMVCGHCMSCTLSARCFFSYK